MKRIRKDRVITVLLCLLSTATLMGCKREPYMLGVFGYNYTDRAVAYFSVNGAGGGNVELSTPTAGGGKTMCCVVMDRDTVTPFWVEVKYKMSALESYPPRKMIEPSQPYKSAKVEVTGPIPKDPSYLEIHFYPDGHIEGAISGRDGPSPPRLKLERRLPYVR
ncbi:DUF3304 domain-containing protein [Paraburkholderia sp. EG287B]|uniref:DUF3304 domain-containing protein n=1 Tax=unclassified Paraburkholderia TaxID=2615204 RepID=UPI0034D1A979